ncbi:MAG: PLP-dependent aminotransferase family protein [Acidobacteria bacterium]|nr:PLP-dependent aminotransferase family protein [Acidobacteriota bacterium]
MSSAPQPRARRTSTGGAGPRRDGNGRPGRMPGTPVYHRIAEGFRQRIRDGSLQPGERLPSVREEALKLRVNRMTVAHAYRTLAREGLVRGTVGSGTIVTGGGSAPPGQPAPAASALLWEGLTNESVDTVAEILRGVESIESDTVRGIAAFERAVPDPDLLRPQLLRNALCAALADEGSRLLGAGPVEGHPELRRAVALLLAGRGLVCSEDDVLIVNGVQQGLDLILRTFFAPGETAVTDDPAYYRSLLLFRYHRAHLRGLPVDTDGNRATMLDSVLSERPARLIYTVSTFHNPTGRTQSREERLEFLVSAQRRPLVLVEDDSLWELRYEGRPVPPLRALDDSNRILSLGSFSKILAPGLRLGWVVGPPQALAALKQVKEIADLRGNLLTQAAVARLVLEGKLAAHVKHTLSIYRKRRDVMATALERYFPSEARWQKPEGGLTFWVTFPQGCDTRRLLDRSQARGVSYCPGTVFRVRGGGENQMRLAFGHLKPAAIERGLKVLGALSHEEVVRGRRDAGGRIRSRAVEAAGPLF